MNPLFEIAQRRGCTIRRTGNLIQVIKQGIGTVFQDHRKSEVERYLCMASTYRTIDNECYGSHFMTDDAICPRKYGRLTKRP